MVPGVPSVQRGNWGWECSSMLYRVLALREYRNLNRLQCFVKKVLERTTVCTFMKTDKQKKN